jgi:hypothetical protein
MDVDVAIQQAIRLASEADALLITAGAGMEVDSGLPFGAEDGRRRIFKSS